MKKYKLMLFFLTVLIAFSACSDDDENAGKPVINSKTEFTGAMFGDSLEFTINASDADVPLSTLKVQLYYGEDMVSSTVIRTKTSDDYTGKIFVPYYADIPNGTATLKLILQNINFTITEETIDLPLTRPDFPYLTFVTAGKEYKMERTGLYEYKVTEDFPRKISGYIKAPAVGKYGNEITFGWANDAIKENSTDDIPFSYSDAAEYSITFNTLTYEAAPFIIVYAINDVLLERVDDNNYKIDLALTKGEEIKVEGFDDFDDWWIDADFFTKASNGKLTFAAIDGNYRITANLQHKYLIVEVLNASNNLATLQADGSGAIWIIGEGIGKPSVTVNAVGWNDKKGLCMVPLGNKKYQMTVVAGKTMTADKINFKFFHQKGWAIAFTNETLTTASDLILVGAGKDINGMDAGNIGLVEDKTFKENTTYVFTMDVSQGNDKAVLSVAEK